MSPKIQHGVVCQMLNEPFGYFGWPTIARMDDGTLIVGASGLRRSHVCPWGQTTLLFSHDDGATWSDLQVVHDSPLDDRDVGVVSLGGQIVLITWFTTDPRQSVDHFYMPHFPADVMRRAEARMSALTDATAREHQGSWTRISFDGGKTFSAPRRAPVSAPHGPILLKNGSMLYLGKQFPTDRRRPDGQVAAAVSIDLGATWKEIGVCPLPEGIVLDQVHEPHVVEMPDGRLIGVLRVEGEAISPLSTWQTESVDGGRTWSVPTRVPVNGAPPHILRHSGGTLICTYGHRNVPFGERAIFSHDEGKTWTGDIPLYEPGFPGDMGYPSTVELPDGSLLTVFYQAVAESETTILRYTRWQLPDDKESSKEEIS